MYASYAGVADDATLCPAYLDRSEQARIIVDAARYLDSSDIALRNASEEGRRGRWRRGVAYRDVALGADVNVWAV